MTKYADLIFAAEYFRTRAYTDKWQALSDEEKNIFLETATTQIDVFCQFYDVDGEAVYYDAEDAPEWLRRACCEQALYLVNLGKDPTQTEDVLAMGIASAKGTVFDRSFVADIICLQCRKIVEQNFGEVSAEAFGGNFSGGIGIGIVAK